MEAWLYLGCAYKELEEMDEAHPGPENPTRNPNPDPDRLRKALEAFGRALALEPRNGKANYHCGRTHHAMGNVKDAVARYNEAIKVMPGNAEARFHIGRALEVEFMAGNRRALKEAQEHFKEAVRLNPKAPTRRSSRTPTPNPRLILTHPQDCEFRCCLARVLGAGGDHNTAADQWAVAVKLAGPSDVELQRKQARPPSS